MRPELTFDSGSWHGFFTDDRAYPGRPAGQQWKLDVHLAFVIHSSDYRSFFGFGTDEIGEFQFTEGRVRAGAVSYFKQYSTHTVTYHGQQRGHMMSGRWFLTDFPWVQGGWSLWPHVQN
ncbi:uncharacterized protein LOC118407429 [Branchiostoma floridae]|uniref:Uncharacterized protein LOC118407429 n=1 Tax=Branchiostoma floridae TaxID=7739 RepID=A0A9J7KHQ5_BRAFL|nr:uncharacterized protein LOC118407429 [Branchiostoma floridae]